MDAGTHSVVITASIDNGQADGVLEFDVTVYASTVTFSEMFPQIMDQEYTIGDAASTTANFYGFNAMAGYFPFFDIENEMFT